MPRSMSQFVCTACGFQSPRWLGRCPQCGQWNTMVEEVVRTSQSKNTSAPMKAREEPAILAMDIPDETIRFGSGMGEFDRVLGGGFVEGSVILLGGEPGIGKSTLLLALSDYVAKTFGPALYVSGEESLSQVRMRAKRLKVSSKSLFFMSARDVDYIIEIADKILPRLLIIDSIQTCQDPQVSGIPGGPSQIQACAEKLQEYAKTRNIATVMSGHSVKSGGLSGPRLLEHLVDTVLFFEGDTNHLYRVIRAHKNRFGPTNEVAVFEMIEDGLKEIPNPSMFFLSEMAKDQSGVSIASCLKGRNPMCVQIEALVSPCPYGNPRRVVSELDYQRAMLILAVISKKLGLNLDSKDVYIKVAGGIKIDDPGVDLACAMAIISSYYDVPLLNHNVFFGEVGLSGEVRAVARMEDRLKEAVRIGFDWVMGPKSFTDQGRSRDSQRNSAPDGQKRPDDESNRKESIIKGVSSLKEAVQNAFPEHNN